MTDNLNVQIVKNDHLTWVKWMRLKTVHHVIISFQQHEMFSSMSIPYKNMATV